MKILSGKQIREADQHTIKNEPIASIDLMERAVSRLVEFIQANYAINTPFAIFCGKGNNGGDGLALARWLGHYGFPVQVYVVEHTDSASPDFTTNLNRLNALGVPVHPIHTTADVPDFDTNTVLVDAMLGSGLSRPLEGLLAQLVQKLNRADNERIAIDIPTGLFADSNAENDPESIFTAHLTLTFQCPKLSLVHRDTAPFAGRVQVLDIGLDPVFLAKADSHHYYDTIHDIKEIFRPRARFSYKGTYGHALLMAGSYGSMGAAIMCGRATLRSGAGLLTAYIPQCGVEVYQAQLPEAMVVAGEDEKYVAGPPAVEKYNAIAAGPGLGTQPNTHEALYELIKASIDKKMVLDADALNILAANRDLLFGLPENTILTPHIGEFKRLLGIDVLGTDYLRYLRTFATEYKVVVILKDSITTIATPQGELYYMDFGTPALAKGGSGDVLTGIVLGLLASGYDACDAARLAVYLQGTAARAAAGATSLEACLATDVVDALGGAFRTLYE